MEDIHMLVLSRRVGEQIQIGDDVVVSVISVHGNRVRLSIAAPPATRIMRTELLRPKGETSSEAIPDELRKRLAPVVGIEQNRKVALAS
jgi:carbon storage regulator